jgi:hypothetical protein
MNVALDFLAAVTTLEGEVSLVVGIHELLVNLVRERLRTMWTVLVESSVRHGSLHNLNLDSNSDRTARTLFVTRKPTWVSIAGQQRTFDHVFNRF